MLAVIEDLLYSFLGEGMLERDMGVFTGSFYSFYQVCIVGVFLGEKGGFELGLQGWFCLEILCYCSPDTWFEVEVIDHDFVDTDVCELRNKLLDVWDGEGGVEWAEEDTGFNPGFCEKFECVESLVQG